MVVIQECVACAVFFITVILICADAGATINDTQTLHSDLMRSYNRYIRPVDDQANVIDVSVSVFLKTLKELDEVQGMLSFTGALILQWRDAALSWEPEQYGGAYYVNFRYPDIWVPDMILLNPADDADTMGKPWQVITVSYDGSTRWDVGGLIRTYCDINDRYYPFDTQSCDALFSAWGYTSEEIRINTAYDKADTSLYMSNPSWHLIDTSVQSMNFTLEGIPSILLTIRLKRKPAFVIVNIVMPILFLSLLNVLVFVLEPESGERVSYCITVLLSIAVFLTIVSNTLPRSSEQIPLISYKLMTDMIISSCITFMTILNLHFYHKERDIEVPQTLQSLYRYLAPCRCCRWTPKRVSRSVIDQNGCGEHRETKPDIDLDLSMKHRVTWRKVSNMVDWICLASFTTFTVISFIAFISMAAII